MALDKDVICDEAYNIHPKSTENVSRETSTYIVPEDRKDTTSSLRDVREVTGLKNIIRI